MIQITSSLEICRNLLSGHVLVHMSQDNRMGFGETIPSAPEVWNSHSHTHPSVAVLFTRRPGAMQEE